MAATVAPSPYETDPGGRSPYEDAAITALAVFLASTAAIHAVTLPAMLVSRLTALGLAPRAVRTAGRMALGEPLTGRTRNGSPEPLPTMPGRPASMTRRMAVQEPLWRARYLLAASKRLSRASVAGEFTAGMRRERNYLEAHHRAGVKRAAAARAYDRVARHATYLKWVARGDADPTCRALDGSIWSVEHPIFPPPGAVHPNCRCVAVPSSG
jgi:hypothetical protein